MAGFRRAATSCSLSCLCQDKLQQRDVSAWAGQRLCNACSSRTAGCALQVPTCPLPVTRTFGGSGTRRSPAGLRGNWSTQHRSFPKPLTVYTTTDKNLDTSLSAAYCLGFLATTKSSLGFGQRSVRPHESSSPEHFFLKATEVPYVQRVSASLPHLHFPTNPTLSNHQAQTYWWPCWGHYPTPPPSLHLIASGSSLPHRRALRHGRKLLWVVSLHFSLC